MEAGIRYRSSQWVGLSTGWPAEGTVQAAFTLSRREQITDAGLEQLNVVISRQDLWLVNTRIADAGLAHVERLSSLHRLDPANTQITDMGLEYLVGPTSRSHLDLTDTQITDARIEELRATQPESKIEAHRKRFAAGVPDQEFDRTR